MPKRTARRDNPMTNKVINDERDLRAAILDATGQLLAERQFDQFSVADILTAAEVSRASFYFYFESKHAVLEALIRRAMEDAHGLAQPWVESDGEPPEKTLREGTRLAVHFWISHAPILRAVVENWRSDERLTQLWTDLMQSFTRAAIERIQQDQTSGRAPANNIDVQTLASSLTWMNERIFYLTAIGHQGFTDAEQVTDVLTHIWLTAIYGA